MVSHLVFYQLMFLGLLAAPAIFEAECATSETHRWVARDGPSARGARADRAALQLLPTGRPEALEPGNPCVLSVTHPARPVQAALSRTTPCCSPPRQAAAARGGEPEASGGSGGVKCLLNFLSVRRARHTASVARGT